MGDIPLDQRVADACLLLDKALLDQRRVEAERAGSRAGPLYLTEIRWDMVRQARDMLGDA